MMFMVMMIARKCSTPDGAPTETFEFLNHFRSTGRLSGRGGPLYGRTRPIISG